MKFHENEPKKGNFENPKVQNRDFSTKLVRFPGDQKTTLTGESLYMVTFYTQNNILQRKKNGEKVASPGN